MRRTLAAACAVMLGLVSALYAQAPYSTWKRWPVTTPPPKSPAAPPQAAGQDRRLGEILVELELLADPVTFPYELDLLKALRGSPAPREFPLRARAFHFGYEQGSLRHTVVIEMPLL